MDQNPKELTLEESIRQVMQTLPPQIRHYLSSGKYSDVARSLMGKHGLRVDQGGVLEREIMLLVMGIEAPDEFIQTLTSEAGLDESTVNSIAQDVNDQIFIPLRAEMRRGEEEKSVARPAVPVPSYQPPPPQKIPSGPPPMPVRPPVPQPPARPASGVNILAGARREAEVFPPQDAVFIPANPQLPPRPVEETYTKFSIPKAKYTPPRPITPSPTPAAVQNPLGPDRLLEDHEEPHIEFRNEAMRIFPPLEKAPLGPRPATVAPPNLPGAMPPLDRAASDAARSGDRPALRDGLAQTSRPVLPPPAAPYSVDPYREPIE